MTKITTRYVRNCYVNSMYSDFAVADPNPAQNPIEPLVAAEFDAWLKEVIRAAKEEAYSQGYLAASSIRMGPMYNPYKKTKTKRMSN